MNHKPMNRRTRFTLTAVFLSMVGASLLAHATPLSPGYRGLFGDKIIKKLDLDTEQQQQLETITRDMRTDFQENRTLRKQLRTLIQSDNYNEAAVAELAEQMAQSLNEQVINHSKQFNALYVSLDEKQRTELAEWEERRREKRSERHYREN